MSEPMLDAAGRRRSAATLPEFHAKRGIERLVAALHGDDAQPHEERLDLVLKVRRTSAPAR